MTLSNQELSSWKQGKLIISSEQLAVCYLISLYSINGNFPSFKLKSSIEEVFIYCGMNRETFRRTVEKFKILILDQQDDDDIIAKEALYPKIINAYEKFIEMKESEILKIANKSFTEDNNKIGLAIEMNLKENKSKSTENYKKKDKEIKNKSVDLFNSLNAIFKNSEKAKRQTINKISKELDVSIERINNIWNKDSFLNTIN